jgi:hypothetical protein
MSILVTSKEGFVTMKKFLILNQYIFTVNYSDIGYLFRIRK